MMRLSFRHVIVNGKSPFITEHVNDARSPTFNCNTVDGNGLNFGGTVEYRFYVVVVVDVVFLLVNS